MIVSRILLRSEKDGSRKSKERISMTSKEACSSSSSSIAIPQEFDEEELLKLYGGESGWVEPKTWCDHLQSLTCDLSHIPTPDTSCFRCHHPAENWVCLFCKDVYCSRFVNKHMLEHYEQKGHCIALSYSDLSVWCFACDAYLDAQVIQQLRVAHETAYLLKFGEAPPARMVDFMQLEDTKASSSSKC